MVGRQVSAAGLEGCADSMDCAENGLEGEPTKGYKGRFCGRLFLKVWTRDQLAGMLATVVSTKCCFC